MAVVDIEFFKLLQPKEAEKSKKGLGSRAPAILIDKQPLSIRIRWQVATGDPLQRRRADEMNDPTRREWNG